MVRYGSALTAVALALCLAACGTTDEKTAQATSSEVSRAADYLKEPTAQKSAPKGWSTGIVLRTRFQENSLGGTHWSMTVLRPSGDTEIIKDAEPTSGGDAETLSEMTTPGDYIAYKAGGDKKIADDQIKILAKAAVDIGG